jgi:exopolysaccharide biosynthesis protein
MKKGIPLLLCLAFILTLTFRLSAQTSGFKNIRWNREKIAPGLILKSSHPEISGLGPQNINILKANIRKRKISILYDPSRNLQVNLQADTSDAIAAVNGGFFNIKEGGSVTYIRTSFRIVDEDTAKKWRRNANMNGSLLIDKKGGIDITGAQTNQWYDDNREYPDVLVTGPLLVHNKKRVSLPETSLVTLRHPRTAIGSKGRFRILMITIDGRTENAEGMTLSDLTGLMISLGCSDAINLDGGGSTTMWIRDKPYNGIINMPCDNKKFDHEGARAVSNIMVVR